MGEQHLSGGGAQPLLGALQWAGHMVSTRLYPNRVDVAAADTLVASHVRLASSGQTTYDWQHYIDLVQRKPGALRNGTPLLDMPPPLLRLRQSLLRHTGGDRVMAQVLARLNTPAAPEQAETTAQLTHVPKADTARYDRLRPTQQDGQEVSHAQYFMGENVIALVWLRGRRSHRGPVPEVRESG